MALFFRIVLNYDVVFRFGYTSREKNQKASFLLKVHPVRVEKIEIYQAIRLNLSHLKNTGEPSSGSFVFYNITYTLLHE